MVKPLSVNVTYKNEFAIINCSKQELPEKVASRFNININDVILFHVEKGQKREISLENITDLMKLELMPRKNGQRDLRSYLDNHLSPVALTESIVKKLTNNTPLSGEERKFVIEKLHSHPELFSKKRKLHQRDDHPPKETSNKKIQVKIASFNLKDSFAQTDRIKIAGNSSNANDDISETLKRLAKNHEENKEEIAQLMKESFQDRRNFIMLKIPPVSVVREAYPALFCNDEVKNELDRIFYPGKCGEFLSNMDKYSRMILRYTSNDELSSRIQKSIDKAKTPLQKSYAETVGSVFCLAKLLEEQFGFIHLSDYPHGSGDVFPYIDASCHSLKDVFFDGVLFHISVEGRHLCEASNFPEAILCLMATFFIFNITYPDSCLRTLTAFEKLYLCANDTIEMDDMTQQMIKLFELQAKEDAKKR